LAVSCFRWFFSCQCFANAIVAFASHGGSVARARISTAAKYLGAFGAGLPSEAEPDRALENPEAMPLAKYSDDLAIVGNSRKQISPVRLPQIDSIA